VDILVLSVDPSQDLATQLRGISESSKIPLLDLIDAWNNRNGPYITAASTHVLSSTIQFDVVQKLKAEEVEEEFREQHSYKAVRERNKFFNRRRR